jgi:hypothetical protein
VVIQNHNFPPAIPSLVIDLALPTPSSFGPFDIFLGFAASVSSSDRPSIFCELLQNGGRGELCSSLPSCAAGLGDKTTPRTVWHEPRDARQDHANHLDFGQSVSWVVSGDAHSTPAKTNFPY